MTRVIRGIAWAAVLLLVAIVMVFAVLRVGADVENLGTGTLPPVGDFDRRYAQYPLLAYAHIVPGVIYLLGAPLQLSRRLRSANLPLHRRRGRLLVASGVVTGVFALGVGAVMPFGGVVEGTATWVFGTWFLTSLVLAFRAVRRGDVRTHRRFMIRAFALGVAVGTIRIWVGLFEATGVLEFQDGFGLAFWLAFTLHAVAAELWLRWRPGRPRRYSPSTSTDPLA